MTGSSTVQKWAVLPVSAITEIVLGAGGPIEFETGATKLQIGCVSKFFVASLLCVLSIGFPPSQVPAVLVRRARPPPIVLLPPIMLLAVAVLQ
jgi:hypothetical protein